MSDSKKHSIVSPSSAARWIACPPSALLAEKFGKDTGSVYADEGTLAHRLAELYLLDILRGRDWLRLHPGKKYEPATENPAGVAEVKKAKKNPLFYDDMLTEVHIYADHAISLLDSAGTGAQMQVEARFPLFYKPDDEGTIDNLVYGGTDKTLYITDLKFGRGVQVDAKNNKQLLIYAINAYDQVRGECEIEKVVMTIVQPRRNSITSWTVDVAYLEMERDMIEAIARKALKGDGNFRTGSHCQFCPVKPRCRALSEETSRVAKLECVDPNILTEGEIAKLLGRIDVIADWIASVKKYALSQALEGVRYEGFKLVAGTSRRQITDEKALLSALIAAGYDGPMFKRTSFVTIGDLEKIVIKKDFTTCCAPYITKQEAPPVLVKAADPRTEYGVAKGVEDFAEFRKS